MKGQAVLTCRDCRRTATVSGELPAEYSSCFRKVIADGGWVVAPGDRGDLLCGECLRSYEGSETHDDAEKVRRR